MNDSIQRLRARWVLPITAPPVENGEIVIEKDQILEVRPASGLVTETIRDFGDAILMPGLVNVHTHLDYTLMRGLLEDLPFFPWIRELTARARTLSPDDWIASATWGAAEALASGITTIGDCSFSGAALVGAKALGLGGIVFQEVFGIDESQTVSCIVEELKEKVHRLRVGAEGSRISVGISPHAPYTVRPALFRALAEYARQDELPICIHAAESQAEMELLHSGTGPFAAMYAQRGISWSAPGTGVVAYLDSFGMLGAKTLLVHGIQISASDRALCQARGVAWAHCPKSNGKLGNGVVPWQMLSGSSARIGLGSDSVASNNTMDLFEEMRFAILMQRASRRRIEALGAQEAVSLATLGGARALNREAEIGSLEPGKRADLCVVRLDGLHASPCYNPYHALVYASRASDVVCTLLSGKIHYDAARSSYVTDRFTHINLAPVRPRLEEAARKMRQWRPDTP